jgi:hypothetical protein
MVKKNTRGVFTTLGSRVGAVNARHPEDFYSTPERATVALIEKETFVRNILEPCCGAGHISRVLDNNGYNTTSYDLVDRGYGLQQDFLAETSIKRWSGDIITNPPYALALEFLKKSLSIINSGNSVAFLLRTLFLEGKERGIFYKEHPPKTIYQFSGRVNCSLNGDETIKQSSALAFAWFVWEKGYKGDTIIKWLD